MSSAAIRPQDRRQHARHDATVLVTFRNDGTSATTRDVSIGGCAILAPRLRLQNERILIGLLHPQTRSELEVTAEVRRAVPLPDGRFLLGVQFVDVSAETRAKITAFMNDIKPPEMDEASKLADEAADAENAGKVADAIRLLERALTASPRRGDILVTRARLASQTGDHRGAAVFARRAAEAEPQNQQFAQLAQRFAEAAPKDPSAEPAAPATPSETVHETPAKPFVPADGRGRAIVALTAIVFVAILGVNLWYWVLRGNPGAPTRLDPAPYRDLVPMSELAVRDGRAYGTVDASWPSLPDREKRIADLAANLQKDGATSVYLSSADAKLVATYRDGSVRLFK